jgi:hypothetical protein
MKKFLLVLFTVLSVILVNTTFISCEDDKEESIVGTSWVWQSGSGNITIHFIDESYATQTYSPDVIVTSQYTYDTYNKDGVLGSSIFTIKGNILTLREQQYYKQ